MLTPEDLPYGHRTTVQDLRPSDIIDGMKRQGFIGLYHPFKGKVYAGSGINEDEDLYHAYLFGENAILSRPQYGEYIFKENIEKHCLEFDVNRIHGMVLPPSEGGVVNNPGDTSLLEPASPPGMIQGARRYSELSKLFPQVTGMIIDDFWANYGRGITYEDLRDIKGALLGKTADTGGRIDLSSPETTPHMKLFAVTYEWEIGLPDPRTLELIDGVNFWMYNQEACYRRFDEYIDTIKARYPHKEVIPGIYIHNSDYGDMSRDAISCLLERCIDLYDAGYVSGVLLFAGHWLVKNYISRERDRKIGLSDLLRRIYYPFLGDTRGQVVDSSNGRPLEKALVRITSVGGRAGIERAVTKKFTNALGFFRFGGWCGHREVSSEYRIYVEKEGYEPKQGTFRMTAKQETVLPAIALSPLKTGRYLDGLQRWPDASQIASGKDREGTGQIEERCTSADLIYPHGVVLPLDESHNWTYTEDQILSVLESANYGRTQPDLWDCDDKAMRGAGALKERLNGCPCGIAIGEIPGTAWFRSVVIYWTSPSSWRFWDPSSRKCVSFCSRYVIA